MLPEGLATELTLPICGGGEQVEGGCPVEPS